LLQVPKSFNGWERRSTVRGQQRDQLAVQVEIS
jgi:hypothetical protein